MIQYTTVPTLGVSKKKKKKLLSHKIALTKDASAHLDFLALYSYFAKEQNLAHFAENQLRTKQSR